LTDLEGNARPIGPRVDAGAYEFSGIAVENESDGRKNEPEITAEPNPFNPRTRIRAGGRPLGMDRKAELSIYDTRGACVSRTVNDGRLFASGVIWDASAQTPGVYFCVLKSGNRTAGMKLVLIR
jgi:hypothetical protein